MLKELKEDSSLLFLIISNLIPIIGILFLNWNVFYMLFYYWLESLVIGFFTIGKMALTDVKTAGISFYSKNNSNEQKIKDIDLSKNKLSGSTEIAAKIFGILFFIAHFGLFMFGHLVFILAIMTISQGSAIPSHLSFNTSLNVHIANGTVTSSGINFQEIKNYLGIITNVLFFVIFLLLSHGISFFTNFIKKREYRKTDFGKVMFSPYSRVILMQAVVIFGALILSVAKAPAAIGILFIFIKCYFDIKAHIKEHAKLQEK